MVKDDMLPGTLNRLHWCTVNSKASELGYKFLVNESTADFIKDSLKLKKLDPVKVKGRSQEIIIYSLA